MGKIISSEEYAIAKINGISRATLYRRIKQGWEMSVATSFPTDHKKNSKRKKSACFGLERGKLRSFKLPLQLEDKWDKMVVSSGLTELDYATEILLNAINNYKI